LEPDCGFAEYGFNLSHAVAYTYISGRLLYLKAHYPREFYTAILSCEKESEKIKEYKMEAKLHGVDLQRLDINKSKFTFDLDGDDIYYGFSTSRDWRQPGQQDRRRPALRIF